MITVRGRGADIRPSPLRQPPERSFVGAGVAGNRSVSPWHRPAGRRVRCAQMTDLGAVRPFTTSARPGHHGLAERIRGSVRNCQAAPKEVKGGQIIEKICIRFDDGIRENSEYALLDLVIIIILQSVTDFLSKYELLTVERECSASKQRHARASGDRNAIICCIDE